MRTRYPNRDERPHTVDTIPVEKGGGGIRPAQQGRPPHVLEAFSCGFIAGVLFLAGLAGLAGLTALLLR